MLPAVDGDRSHPLKQLRRRRHVDARIGHHGTGRRRRCRTDNHRPGRVGDIESRCRCRYEQIEGHDHIGLAAAEARRGRPADPLQPQIAHHRARLLRQPDLVETSHLEAVEHRRRAKHLVDRHHAGAADPAHAHRHLIGTDERYRIGQLIGRFGSSAVAGAIAAACRLLALQRCQHLAHRSAEWSRLRHRHKRRAIAVEARVVEVARRLIDAGLAPEEGVNGLYRQAVALGAAVAAAFTDSLVDQHSLGRRGLCAALAGPSRLGRALLIVDEHRDAIDAGEQLLGLGQAIAMPHLDTGRQGTAAIASGIVRGDEHPGHTSRQQPGCHVGHLQLPSGILPTCHRDSPVPQQLVGDIGARGHRAGNRQLAAVKIGAVSQVLEDVLCLDEGRHADPLRALLTHARQAHNVADPLRIHEQRHRVTADPGAHDGAVRYLGGPVVRTTRAEVRRAALPGSQCHFDAHALRLALHQPVTDASLQPPAQRLNQLIGCQRSVRAEQNLIALIGLADDAGMVRLVVEGVFEQRLDIGTLLFDHEDLRNPAGEVPGPIGAERDRHAHAHEPDTCVPDRFIAAEAQPSQCLANLAVGDA